MIFFIEDSFVSVRGSTAVNKKGVYFLTVQSYKLPPRLLSSNYTILLSNHTHITLKSYKTTLKSYKAPTHKHFRTLYLQGGSGLSDYFL